MWTILDKSRYIRYSNGRPRIYSISALHEFSASSSAWWSSSRRWSPSCWQRSATGKRCSSSRRSASRSASSCSAPSTTLKKPSRRRWSRWRHWPGFRWSTILSLCCSLWWVSLSRPVPPLQKVGRIKPKQCHLILPLSLMLDVWSILNNGLLHT